MASASPARPALRFDLQRAANAVGPSMCFENHIIMSPVKNNVGRGLNITLVNGTMGLVPRHNSFNMYWRHQDFSAIP